MLDFQAARWSIDNEVPGQAGNDHPTSIPTGVFQTTDGYINIAASGGTMWERLCDLLEADELREQSRLCGRWGAVTEPGCIERGIARIFLNPK